MKKLFLLVAIVVACASCGRFGNDESGAKKDTRIVCLSKHLTEMMFALGQGKNIVAVDLSSTYPDSAKLLKTVGYHRALSPESIIAMNPDLVIHSNDIGPENVLPQITKAGLNIHVFIPQVFSDLSNPLFVFFGSKLACQFLVGNFIASTE